MPHDVHWSNGLTIPNRMGTIVIAAMIMAIIVMTILNRLLRLLSSVDLLLLSPAPWLFLFVGFLSIAKL